MLKETETKDTIIFYVTFLLLAAIELGGGGSLPPFPLGYAYALPSAC